jgi:NADH-quinone oxidoreductase subunit G
VQRIGRAFPPLGGAREDWRILLDLAARLKLSLDYRGPAEIFLALADELPAFAGLTYETIGAQGVDIAREAAP